MNYPTQHPTWLSLAAQDGRGGISTQPPTIVRGQTKAFIMSLNAHPIYGDWTDGSFSADLRASPDAPTALATWSVAVGTPAGGVTPVTLTLSGSAQSDIPADTDGDGATEVLMQVDYTPAGGTPDAIMQTRALFVGNV